MTEPFENDPIWCRVTIRAGRITLNRWSPRLMTSGPSRRILRDLADHGTALADLRSLVDEETGEEDLVVTWVPCDGGGDAAEETLLEWARTTGYRRVWLPGRVVELEDELAPGGAARVECPTCGLEWDDAGPDFWATVRDNGFFPGSCLACGGSLPEWRADVAAHEPEPEPEPARRRTVRLTGSS